MLCSPRADTHTQRQTDRQTDTNVNTEDTLSGFHEFSLQPIIKDRSNIWIIKQVQEVYQYQSNIDHWTGLSATQFCCYESALDCSSFKMATYVILCHVMKHLYKDIFTVFPFMCLNIIPVILLAFLTVLVIWSLTLPLRCNAHSVDCRGTRLYGETLTASICSKQIQSNNTVHLRHYHYKILFTATTGCFSYQNISSFY